MKPKKTKSKSKIQRSTNAKMVQPVNVIYKDINTPKCNCKCKTYTNTEIYIYINETKKDKK